MYCLIDPAKLVPTEEIDVTRLCEVERDITQSGRWKVPVSVHKDVYFVMDGHHRLEVANRLGLRVLPVVLLDYGSVRVTSWRPGETITEKDVWGMYRAGQKFPCKTTRHIFDLQLNNCDISLDDLRCFSPEPAPTYYRSH
ncbi:hypothetical protein E1297_07375 [Roseibium sp. RKSG952]|nr:hypothetical protein [Roseibium sp. RKSG952]